MRTFGTSWWRTSLGLGAALILPGCDELELRRDQPVMTENEHTFQSSVDALSLQRAHGWNVGADGPLSFDTSSVRDAAGGQSWRRGMETLATRLAPSQPRLLPWYVPTLFQSLVGPQGQLLRAEMRPIRSAPMDDDFARGLALRSLFEQADWPADTAIIVDAPGPSAVAVAAALADHFDPVFTFGNWPHPDGVVPAHETLAAALYYAPVFERGRALRPAVAPPVFVLDANRLAPYTEEADRFDNRYFVRLPPAEVLAGLGIRHVLYVNLDGADELDDLNDALVELQGQGLGVRLLALDEFQRGDPVAEGDEPDEEASDDLAFWLRVDWFWFDGEPGFHACFWDRYGWYQPRHGVMVGPPGGRRLLAVMPGMRKAIASRFDGSRWSPHLRPTRFGRLTNGLGPAGFGQVPIAAARTDGSFAGFGGARATNRSGYRGTFSHGGASSDGSRGGSWSHSGGFFGHSGTIRSGSLGRFGGGFSS
jgi:hypothetical protein